MCFLLCRYSSIEVSHLAGELSLDESLVEAKISKMILDGVVHGTLSGGLLILYVITISLSLSLSVTIASSLEKPNIREIE